MIFRYFLRERIQARVIPDMDDPDEEVYLDFQVSRETKRRLTERSESEQANLASFSGRLLDAFLSKHEKDPRDLGMVHYFLSRLDDSAVISEQDLRLGITRCERPQEARLPPGYFARWLHSRLRPLVNSVLRDGAPVSLTPQLLEEILAEQSVTLPERE
jgi:hypothetical protein